MSILTECNYCKYKAIVKFQKKVGNRVVKVSSTKMERMGNGGWEIHVMKKGEKTTKKNWICWLREIPESCRC